MALKPVRWVGSSKKDFMTFPGEVQDEMGHALYRAQLGAMHVGAKALKGFGGGEPHRVDRPIGAAAVYVLHAFQKKSRTGIRTDRGDIALARKRLRIAEDEFKQSRQEAENGKEH
jgi:phage-related protein